MTTEERAHDQASHFPKRFTLASQEGSRRGARHGSPAASPLHRHDRGHGPFVKFGHAHNGYYRGYRGSFYAADSGLNIARQQMVNQLLAAGSGALSATAQPIPAGTASTVVSTINAAFGNSYQSLNSGQAAGSWPESFKLDSSGTTLSAPTCTVIGGGGTCAAPTGPLTGYP